MLPSRNKICFHGPPTAETIRLCNPEVRELIMMQALVGFKDIDYTFQSKTVIEGVEVVKSGNTFHQNDDNIRERLYHILFPEIKKCTGNLLFIGGECYIFAMIADRYSVFENREIVTYSDCKDIIEACYANCNSVTAKLVNYNTVYFDVEKKYELCILNVSKKGLGCALVGCVKKLVVENPNMKVYYISCNEKSFAKDGLPYIDRWDFNCVSGKISYGVTLYRCY